MEALTVRPKNRKQLIAVKSVLKALDVSFEPIESPYNPEFVERVLLAKDELRQGKGVRIKIEDLWK